MAYSTSQNSEKFGIDKNSKITKAITRVAKVLEKFKDNYEKRLNFTKLTHLLNLNPSEADQIIAFVLTFQELFLNTFDAYFIKKEIRDNQIFLVAEPKRNNHCIPKKIKLSYEDFNLLSDIVYMFKFVKRGKGFDVKTNGTELLSNIKELWNYHPYFFEKHKNGLYPSKLGLKLGELILSYKKSGKKIEFITIDKHIIQVDNHKRK